MGLLLNWARELLKMDMEKSKVLSAFSASVFAGKNYPSGIPCL